ncbi:MAG: DNA gyrase inhibitor YacG [Candidatus Binataceae bacterium]
MLRCPVCKKPADRSAKNPFRPFCSERCRTVDLGAWAAGEYRVAGKAADDTEHPGDLKKRPRPD